MTASPPRVAPRAHESIQPANMEVVNSRSEVRPRLLVSVRSANEAHRALTGGAEILDVKEPSLGSLGMSNVQAITEIATIESIVARNVPLSVALGEVTDWNLPQSIPMLPPGITYAKLGLSGCADRSDWREQWARIRAEFQQRSESKLKWVAVAYADSNEAASPAIGSILDAAIESKCAGLLIDTWTKGTRTLVDFLGAPEIKAIAECCHQAGLFLALAGKISPETLPQITSIPADIVAIRSAACNNTERTAELDSSRVTEFLNNLQRQFAASENKLSVP